MKYLLLLSTLFFISLPAFSQITIGGGCMLEGDLCEEDDYSRLVVLDVKPQLAQLKQKTQELPGLGIYLERLAIKEWYLEDRPFNKELCGPQGIAEEGSSNYEIVACQVVSEVRISTKFWSKASAEQKAKLVLHELMLSWAIEKKLTAAHMRKASYLILQKINEPLFVRFKLADLGMPFFNLKAEEETIIRFAVNNMKAFAGPDAEAEISKRWLQVPVNNSFNRPDFDEMAKAIFQKIIEKAKKETYITVSDIYLTSTIEVLLREWELKSTIK